MEGTRCRRPWRRGEPVRDEQRPSRDPHGDDDDLVGPGGEELVLKVVKRKGEKRKKM